MLSLNKDLKFTKFLSETNFMDKIDFNKPFKVMVDAPTGAGKTHYIVSYLKEKNIPFVFLADTLLLMKQIANDNDLPFYSAENKDSYNQPQVISVYNHISKLCRNKVVVIDEAHSLVTDYLFKQNIIDDVLDAASLSEKVILLSGTPLVSKDEFYNDLRTIKCLKLRPASYVINAIGCESKEEKYAQAVQLALNLKESGKTPVFSLLDTKDELNTLVELLKANGFDNIGLVNSVVKDGELDLDSTHYEELITKGTITADVVITTYVQGYNINNENCGLIFVPTTNKHSYIAIAQMVARFRKIEDLEIYLLYGNSEGVHYNNLLEFQTVTYETVKKLAVDVLTRIKRNSKTSRAARALLKLEEDYKYLINEELAVNEQMVANKVVRDMSNAMYAYIDNANYLLNQFNITIKHFEQKLNTINNMNTKEEKEIDYKIAVVQFFNYLKIGKYPDTPMMHKVSKAYDKFKVFGLLDTEVEKILLEVFGNTKETNREEFKLSLRKSEDTQLKLIRKGILTSFTKNQWYSSKEIFDIVSKIVEENGGTCKSKNVASETLNALFETEEHVKRVNGKNTRGLTIKQVK